MQRFGGVAAKQLRPAYEDPCAAVDEECGEFNAGVQLAGTVGQGSPTPPVPVIYKYCRF
jgi:hypothetical protein